MPPYMSRRTVIRSKPIVTVVKSVLCNSIIIFCQVGSMLFLSSQVLLVANVERIGLHHCKPSTCVNSLYNQIGPGAVAAPANGVRYAFS